MSRIIALGTAVPSYKAKQTEVLHFMTEAYNNETDARKLNILFKNSGIDYRYSVLPDFDTEHSRRDFFNSSQLPNVEERMNIFKLHALSLAENAVSNAVEKLETSIPVIGFTHLITVTCTGMYSPGIDTELIEKLNLPPDIFHTSINFMGCNAAFHALKLADLIVHNDLDAKVLLVCVELCTLHFQPKNNHDNLLSNTIFGDGAAAAIVTSNGYADRNFFKGFRIKDFYSLVVNKGKPLMGWNITPLNFEMVLDARVPDVLSEEIENIVKSALKKARLQFEDIDLWAIHPGGKKILDSLRKQLHLTDEMVEYSYQILKEYGNMSSPTILFVLKEMEQQNNLDKTIFSIGFGPGLTIESAFMTYVR